jgi:hypothetical protein
VIALLCGVSFLAALFLPHGFCRKQQQPAVMFGGADAGWEC